MALDRHDFRLLESISELVNEGNSNNKKTHREMMAAFNRIAKAIESNTAEVRLMREELGPQKINKIKEFKP